MCLYMWDLHTGNRFFAEAKCYDGKRGKYHGKKLRKMQMHSTLVNYIIKK